MREMVLLNPDQGLSIVTVLCPECENISRIALKLPYYHESSAKFARSWKCPICNSTFESCTPKGSRDWQAAYMDYKQDMKVYIQNAKGRYMDRMNAVKTNQTESITDTKTSSTLDNKIDLWKKKLLDLGRRNRLVNFKDTRMSTLRILKPSCQNLYEDFVVKEHALAFPKDESSEIETLFDLEPAIKTDKSSADLPRVLRNIRNKAKTALEEQGINMLYLTFGFLRYREAAHSNIDLYAPIVLVPVSLTIESIMDPYVLTLHEDEIVVNPTLVQKLNQEYGVNLPEFEDTDDLSGYFNTIRKIVKHNGWDIEEGVALGLLSFLKINMYNDIENHTDKLKTNLIVRAIGGDKSTLEMISDNVIDFSDYNFDGKDDPKRDFQIVDADSSQEEAIILAKKGVSFVLQGPPGTGKSQTITNIIAESLAAGKKVLFVSEKQAALDVVYHRLATAGLADFCLVLHSYKANKRAVLDQLEKTMALASKKATLTDEVYLKLNALCNDRDRLNEYVKELHTEIEPLKKTIYEVNGALANLDSFPNIIFDIPQVRTMSRSDLVDIEYTLHRYANVISQLKEDYNKNPWRGANLDFVSNEYRHDAGANLPALKDAFLSAVHTIDFVNESTGIGVLYTFESVANAANLLNTLTDSYSIPVNWIDDPQLYSYSIDIQEADERQQEFHRIEASIRENYESDNGSVCVDNLAQTTELKNEISVVLSETGPYMYWERKNIQEIENWISQINQAQKNITAVENQILQEYDSGIFNVDYKDILVRIRTEYTTFFKVLKSSYKADKKQILAYRKVLNTKLSDAEMLDIVTKLTNREALYGWFETNRCQLDELFGEGVIQSNTQLDVLFEKIKKYKQLKKALIDLDKLAEIHSIELNSSITNSHRFAERYHGFKTDWVDVKNALNWALHFQTAVKLYKPQSEFVKTVCESVQSAQKIYTLREKLLSILDLPQSKPYRWFIESFEEPNEFYNMDFRTFASRVGECRVTLEQLEEWIDYRAARIECKKIGLSEYIDIAYDHNISPDDLVSVYRKRFYRLWLDAFLPDNTSVRDFRRRDQEQRIIEFSGLDRLQFEIARSRIKGQLINGLPSFTHFTKGMDEVGILKRELKKQRKIMPIRRLFKAIPNLLLTLKPCLMMSPLSVSLFLEADTYSFDLVVFDEASQVLTENAIGAIARGKQVIIAGDSKQLPPTNFFQSTVEEGDYDFDEDDEEDLGIYESVLDEANMLPEKTLLWHYRSRHESLIAFSNAKIYKNSLITFPSNVESLSDNGVEYVYVREGFYDRGGRKGNVVEARRVAELVFEHFNKYPERSLGVIAFGEVQQNAIDTELRTMRLNDHSKESFFSEDKEEPFFVKSLENVQGDERDTIIFSIGYAKDINGVFRNQFGPLGKSGGERRLNVAITRAKINVKLVGSILPTDIAVERINSEGPKLLRAYIDYAIHGPRVLAQEIEESDIVEHDSPFEEAVYNFLDRKGYKLATQVGCSGYRIDMAVKHPTLSGVYVLGIECDGASYHSAKTARERDRLRQSVLENMGWKLYRIWSTDWIKDPSTEGARLIEAIEEAIQKYDFEEIPLEVQEKIESNKNEDSFVQIKECATDRINPTASYGFTKQSLYTFSDLPRKNGYLDLRDCIKKVVDNEYPIHFDLLCQRLSSLYNSEKATSRVKNGIRWGLSGLKEQVIMKGEFLFPASYTEIPIRMPNNRQIQYISIEELSTAMLKILVKCIGTTRQALIDETVRAYGFMRNGPKISAAMEEAFSLLVSSGKIEEFEGKVRLCNSIL